MSEPATVTIILSFPDNPERNMVAADTIDAPENSEDMRRLTVSLVKALMQRFSYA